MIKLCIALVSLAIFSGCAVSSSGVKETADKMPVALFDQGHGQRFIVERKDRLDLSTMADVFVAQGYTVRGTYGELTPERLKDVDALIISGPLSAITEAEAANILSMLDRGGSLAVMMHIAPTLAPLMDRLGVAATRGSINETSSFLINSDAKNFYAEGLAGHPLFEGVNMFDLYGSWGLIAAREGVTILARTSNGAWVDENLDGIYNEGEARGELGLVAEGMAGKGRFVVFGDDAIFQNIFIVDDNLALARNLAKWLKSQN